MSAASERPEPLHELAHIGHGAIFTPTYEETRDFFVELFGMSIIAEYPGVCYLRAYGDYERWSFKVTASEQAGLDHVAWRTHSPQALERRVAWLEANGHAGEWVEPDHGKGPGYRFMDPDNHPFHIYYETERYVAPEQERPTIPTNFQRYAGRGANVKHLGHVNLLAPDVGACRRFWEEGFGIRTYEIIQGDDGGELGAWMSSSIQGHELIYTQEHTSGRGRLHHFAYDVETREEVLRAAEVMMDGGVHIEAGPGRHTAIQGFYLYLREPGGNRVEVSNGAYLRFAPDPEPYVWTEALWKAKPGWGYPLPPEFHVYGTPDVR